MRPVLIALAVVAAALVVLGVAFTTPRPAGAGQVCIRGDSWCATEIAENRASDDHRAEQLDEIHRAEMERKAADLDYLADTYLAAELSVATYWRSAFERHDPVTGERMGQLNNLYDNEDRYRYLCDVNYDDALTGGCVPADRDYDCAELRSWGIAGIPVIGEDWMLLDEDGNGWGCEFPGFASIAPRSAAVQNAPVAVPTAEPADPCDGVVGMLGCFLFGR